MKNKLVCNGSRIYSGPCGWSGDILEAKRISDRGFIGGVWWYVSWHCPKCMTKLAEINQNSSLNNELQQYS